jgi:hypothetical protein
MVDLFSALPHSLPARRQVRELVAAMAARQQAAVARGANPHHTALDQKDALMLFVSRLRDEDATVFLRMYIEETDALTRDITAQTAQIEARAQARIERQRAQAEARRLPDALKMGMVLFAIGLALIWMLAP